MKPEIRELLAQLDGKLNEMRSFIGENKLEEAETAKTQAAEIRKKIDLLKGAEDLSFNNNHNPIAGEGKRTSEQEEAEVRSAFAKSLRGKSLNDSEQRAMSGLAGADGGLVIPQDISTQIHMLMRQYDALQQFVRVEPVTTRSGSRVLEKFATMTGFSNITELGTISETDTPQFTNLSYAIQDYAGILPISNTLLEDSDQNLFNYLAVWIARKSMVTRNTKILNILQTLTTKTFTGFDDVKTFFNTGLDPALAAGSVVVTNQDGFNFLDEQKDTLGRYLLQPDPSQPSRKLLFGKPVAIVANRWLPTVTGTNNLAPFIAGNLDETLVLFDRQQYEIKTTNVGGDSFKRNSTDARVIDRFDTRLWDSAAAVYGSLQIS